MDELAAAEVRAALMGKRCWYAFISFGCTFAVDLGRKVSRSPEEVAALDRLHAKRPSGHPVEYRRFQGESHLVVWCSWRIEQAGRPLASSDSEPEESKAAVRRLVGKTVRQVDILSGWDLRLTLTSDLTVKVFPDHVGPAANFDGNWELWRPEQAYLIGTDLTCQVIDRQNRRLGPESGYGRWKVAGEAKVRK